MFLRSHLGGVVFAAGFALVLSSPAWALTVPSAEDQDVLIKTSLMTFNDANLTGNYAVLQAKTAKPFRDKFSADQLKQTFKVFSDKNIDLSGAVAKPVKPSADAKIEDDVLTLAGTIAITPSYTVTYSFSYIQSDGAWKLVGLNVKT